MAKAEPPPALWHLCEQCRCSIPPKDRDQHAQHCPIHAPDNIGASTTPIPTAFVHDRRLYTNSVSTALPAEALIADLPAAQLSGFVFVSESTMSACGWILGDLVACRSPQLTAALGAAGPAVVRSVWPVPDRYGATVFVPADGGFFLENRENVSDICNLRFHYTPELQSTWHGLRDIQLIIGRHDDLPTPAADITIAQLQPDDAANTPDTIDDAQWRHLRTVIVQQFYGRVLAPGSRLGFEFFNKTFVFEVRSCLAMATDTTATATDPEAAADALSQQLDGLRLSTETTNIRYFTVTQRTQFKLEKRSQDAAADSDTVPNRTSTVDQIGGLDETVRRLRELADLAFGRIASLRGIQISRTVLVHGLPGCGKTLLCEAIAATQTGALVVRVNASEVFSKYFGETEANLRAHFDRAFANHPRPTVMIIEEIVNVCAKEAKEDSAKRVGAAFLNALDAVHSRRDGAMVLVLATTSNVEAINPAARRCGRLDVEIEIPVPNPEARAAILQRHVARVASDVQPDELRTLANQCHGFVGSDLASLVAKAALHATNEAAKTSPAPASEIRLKLGDIQQVFGLVKPSAMREVLIECPNVRWSDIGGQADLKLQLKQAIEWPLTHPERFTRLGIQPPRGILMFGPPGCSKTMIAKALATESHVNFLSIKGPELFSMWVGESEKAVRDLFRKARTVAPAIIFFDEIDAIGGERAGSGAGSSVKERVLAQLLTEMDGVNALQNVTIVAATNRPDLIDTALMRPGRIDRIVYVRLPDAETREEIFRIKMRRMPVAEDVDVATLVAATEGYSGAEVQAICQEAALKALETDFEAQSVGKRDFERALQLVQRRTSGELLKLYDEYLRNF